jgi:hypothetical protein
MSLKKVSFFLIWNPFNFLTIDTPWLLEHIEHHRMRWHLLTSPSLTHSISLHRGINTLATPHKNVSSLVIHQEFYYGFTRHIFSTIQTHHPHHPHATPSPSNRTTSSIIPHQQPWRWKPSSPVGPPIAFTYIARPFRQANCLLLPWSIIWWVHSTANVLLREDSDNNFCLFMLFHRCCLFSVFDVSELPVRLTVCTILLLFISAVLDCFSEFLFHLSIDADCFDVPCDDVLTQFLHSHSYCHRLLLFSFGLVRCYLQRLPGSIHCILSIICCRQYLSGAAIEMKLFYLILLFEWDWLHWRALHELIFLQQHKNYHMNDYVWHRLYIFWWNQLLLSCC